jgi:hypothetical protein
VIHSLHAASLAVVVALAGARASPIAIAAAEDRAPWAAAEPRPWPCFSARASPVYQGVGWTHFVDVVNDCADSIACDVATTVDPQPVHAIRVAPGEIARVRTRYGSVTWAFEPIVECRPSEA